jgi:hypothetical protein
VRYCATECITTISKLWSGTAANSSGDRTSILPLPALRVAIAARTVGAASHSTSRPATTATRSAASASPQP